MGNAFHQQLVYLGEPEREKELDSGSSGDVQFGACGMQGWRRGMEDAHLAVPDFDEGIGLYGVFDGHGGRGVSRFVARHLPKAVRSSAAYAAGDYEKALYDAFLEMDCKLQTPEGQEEVAELDRRKPEETKREHLIQVPAAVVRRYQPGLLGEDTAADTEEEDATQDADEATAQEGAEEHATEEADVALDLAGDLMCDLTSDSSDHSPPPKRRNTRSPDGEAREEEEIETPAAVPEGEAPAVEVPAGLLDMELPDAAVAGVEEEDLPEVLEEEEEEEEDDDALWDTADGDDDSVILLDPAELRGPAGPAGQGCTAVVALLLKNVSPPRLVVANAGDSRCVLCRGVSSVAMSEDHKPECPGETARIIAAGGKVVSCGGGARVQGDLNLSRAIGDLRYKQTAGLPPAEQMITAAPECRSIDLTPEDRFVLLACDGIWERFDNEQAVNFALRKMAERSERTQSSIADIMGEMCDTVCCPSMALTNGTGLDNMTALLVTINPQAWENIGSLPDLTPSEMTTDGVISMLRQLEKHAAEEEEEEKAASVVDQEQLPPNVELPQEEASQEEKSEKERKEETDEAVVVHF